MVTKYKVTLQSDERQSLEAITQKGSHQSRKVINALILLNCDEGEWNHQRLRGEEVAKVLQVSMRKLDRVKKRFVEEGLDAGRCGCLPTVPSNSSTSTAFPTRRSAGF